MDTPLCRVEIDQSALLHNFRFLQKTGLPLMPVIKADAYGHGLQLCASLYAAEGVTHLAVGSVEEACLVRKNGFNGHIIALLGLTSREDAQLATAFNITPVVHSFQNLRLAAQTLKNHPIALKVDTGMARLGFGVQDTPEVARFLSTTSLTPDFLLSHLAEADSPEAEDFTHNQHALLLQSAAPLQALNPSITLSLGNSACLLAYPQLAGNLGRPGIALYGGNPFFNTSLAIAGENLKPAMAVKAPVLSVHPLDAGKTIGYGRTFTTDKPTTVAIIGIGYADGYRRNPKTAPLLQGGACMAFTDPQSPDFGFRAPVIGRVSMQMTCLDITNAPFPLQEGDWAWIMGGPHAVAIHPHELATWWNTISYEVMCQLGKNRR